MRGKYDTSSGFAGGSEQPEPPTTYLWTLYFLAQHHSHLRQYSQALSIVDTALAHTPTLPELHTCKARILKRAGDIIGGTRCMEDARRLDGQDRFLNTKSAKYHLRAGLSTEASAILGLFTKVRIVSICVLFSYRNSFDLPSRCQKDITPAADLEDMQSMLYLIEEGDCQNRLGRLGPALKKYLAVQKVRPTNILSLVDTSSRLKGL